ncbi:MAG: ATP-binding protein [Desulfobacterales bacterium]|nr:ATP-binding protein [Desulfobacterales bacterium]
MITKAKQNELYVILSYLCLSGVKEIFEESLERAEQESMSYSDYILYLLGYESDVRKNKKIARLLKESRLPIGKTLDTFDMKRLPLKLQQKTTAILDGSFIDRRENILAFGLPGSGKTHLLCAIAYEQIKAGRRILFTTCSLLVQRLLMAKKELQLEKLLKRLSKYEAVIIDDIGYVQQDRSEMEVLFTFLAERYERGSLMITSNLPFSKWEKIFKDPMTTAAAIDRLVHHSIILELNIKSYRTEAVQKKNKEEEKET